MATEKKGYNVLDGRGPRAHISRKSMLAEVVKAVNGSEPVLNFYDSEGSFVQMQGYFFAPRPGGGTVSLDAVGLLCETWEEAEESVCYNLIRAAQRQLGVVVDDMNLVVAWGERREKERSAAIAGAFRDGWDKTLGHLESVQKACDEMWVDAAREEPMPGVTTSIVGLAEWAEWCVWDGLAAKDDLEKSVG
ncbi:hypothetical protein EJB05_05181 [Eragrostis curvula]|uniref:Uncharacterized protein n=1 Tax=Eragrostis curvula TaxID=38414 RepID=A0A5J9WCQ1_9POAL|nr:hypothetical protein EJB05_05181 [Eragrostis curvula]